MGGGQRVLIDKLYYGSTSCSCCGLEVDNSAGIQFSPEVLKDFLQKLYEGFDTSEEIEASAWREVLRIMNEASVEGLLASGHTTHEREFLTRLKHSNEVFSAFKVHSMASQMQARLHDSEGKLRTFKEWREAIAPIASHQVGSWLKTEYDTAILRAHQASDWQEFERNRDILPNLRWMPTTSPTPETTHEGFWSSGLTLPIDDPFWAEHHPANRWNCKCSLEATDEPVDRALGEEVPEPTAQQGLELNPRHGRTFSDKHPYFPKSCNTCPYYKPSGLKNKLQALFRNRSKDCYNCPYINVVLDKAKIAEGEIYTPDKDYGKRLLTSVKADPTDLADNRRVAKALLDSFPDMKVKIRPHIRGVKGHKNPELEINGLIAESKRIKGEEGVTSAFKDKREQNYKVVVLDLDAVLKRLRVNDLSKYISRRKNDLPGNINECYVVFRGQAVLLTTRDKNTVVRTLSKLKEKTSE